MTDKERVQGFSISDKSACLIGCGGLGCNVAVHLVGAGIGKLYLCDFDNVSASNLNRQFLYTENDIGESKCLSAKRHLSKYSADTMLLAIEEKILSEEDLDFAKNCDIIILAVDNTECRKVAESFCTENNIPLVCGGIDGFYGMCYLYIPGESPCPDCASMNSGISAQYNISAVAGVIGSLQSTLAIKFLLSNDRKLAGKILVFDECNIDTLGIKPDPDCKICNKIN